MEVTGIRCHKTGMIFLVGGGGGGLLNPKLGINCDADFESCNLHILGHT